MRFIAAFVVFVVGFAPTAFAQSNWVVVPASTGKNVDWMQPTASSLSAALSEQRVGVMSPEQAVVQFEGKGSVASTLVSDSDIDQWVTRSREAIRHLARGDYSTALEELKQAQMISRKAVDELNREKHRAQNVLDTCLYLVRALLETGNRARARTQTQECVRLVPRGEPNQHMHPPSVVSLYKEASQAGPEDTGALAVESKPSGCAVRINGLRFGQTPFEMAGLYQGDYQVQVECEPTQRGRVHPVRVEAGRTDVFVDVEFDRAIRTDPLLHLKYRSKSEAKRQIRDAQTVANVLGAGAAVLVTVPSLEIMEIQVVSGTDQRAGLVRIPTTASGPKGRAVAAAAAALAKGQCQDLTGPKPVDLQCKTARATAPPKAKETPSGWPADRPPRGQWISGLTLASVGGAALLTGYGFLIARGGISDPNASPSEREKWYNLHSGVLIFSVSGAAMTTAAMPLVLPYRAKTPWWAWMSGGIGVGFLVGSIVSAVTAEGGSQQSSLKCFESNDITDVCQKRGQSVDRAILLGMTAAPLLTMPLVYLFRKEEKKRAVRLNPSLSAGRNGGYFKLSGTF